ncbi:TfoX/Sxy family protein [Miniphocaeibacter massiliensis]|uniref:TfoX/Sxy family protein n=1 Tax=Miniphocaeibacter massiliensis TaxID=2041841 RepID=UPI000C1C7DC8|nr:TfoX/Sxy family protein [Miniphocaeibacter massiliensis]
MTELRKLPNIGIIIEKQLNEIGIETIEDLKNVGSQVAWLKIREEVDPSSCLTKLKAIECAIQGIKIQELSEADKKKLEEFYKVNKF